MLRFRRMILSRGNPLTFTRLTLDPLIVGRRNALRLNAADKGGFILSSLARHGYGTVLFQ